MALPIFQTPNQDISLLQSSWASQLNPLLAKDFLKGLNLVDVALGAGETVISHGLGRQPQGWLITDLNANEGVWRTAWTPLTLTLSASGPVTVSIYVF